VRPFKRAMKMWVDLLISTPVTLFVLWLYWYSAPPRRPRGLRALDVCLMALAPVVVAAIICGGHAWIDYPGMGLNVMLVASAYIALLTVLAIGWLLRAWLVRSHNDPES